MGFEKPRDRTSETPKTKEDLQKLRKQAEALNATEKPYRLIEMDGDEKSQELLQMLEIRHNACSAGTAEHNPLATHTKPSIRDRVKIYTDRKNPENPVTVMELQNRPEIILNGNYENFYMEFTYSYRRPKTDKPLAENLSDSLSIGFNTTGKLVSNWTNEMADGHQLRLSASGKHIGLTKTTSADGGKTATIENVGTNAEMDFKEGEKYKIQIVKNKAGLKAFVNSGVDVKTKADVEALALKDAKFTVGKGDIDTIADTGSNHRIALSNREPSSQVPMTSILEGFKVMNLDA